MARQTKTLLVLELMSERVKRAYACRQIVDEDTYLRSRAIRQGQLLLPPTVGVRFCRFCATQR